MMARSAPERDSAARRACFGGPHPAAPPARRISWFVSGLALFLLSLSLELGAAEPDRPAQGVGGDFSLTDQHGRPFALHDLRGRVVLLSFGYTYCPDICPLTLSLSAQVIKALGERGRDVVPVFVSLDPKRDSPEVLAPYVRYFHPDMIGLTGSMEQLEKVAGQYQARFAFHGDRQGDRYTLDHSASLYVIDRSGALSAIVPYGLPAQYILERVEPLLTQPGDSG